MTKNLPSFVDLNQFQQINEFIFSTAKTLGVDQAEFAISANKGFSVSVHNGDVETVEYHQDKILEMTVYVNNRVGTSSISDLRLDAVKKALETAYHIAKFTDSDAQAGIADKDELAFHYPQLDIYTPWNITVDEAIKLGVECEAIALATDKRILSAEETAIRTAEGFHFYANSHGFCGHFADTRHEISCITIAKQKDEMQRDYSYTIASNPKDLSAIDTIAKDAAKKSVHRLGARKITTQKVPVIFQAEEARSLFGHFLAAISGRNIYRKSSFLIDKIGENIFPEFISLHEEPHLAHGLGSAPFDNDGVPTRHNKLIERGRLNQYVLSVYTARKLGMKTTGNAGGVHNLIVPHGNKDLSALIKTLPRGMLVTELLGQGVNIVSGDYSRGASGFWIENGEIVYPLDEVTLAGNLKDMFLHIQEIANDVDVRGNIRTGSVLIEGLTVAGS